jgi:hypothetical protein
MMRKQQDDDETHLVGVAVLLRLQYEEERLESLPPDANDHDQRKPLRAAGAAGFAMQQLGRGR